MSGKPLLLSDDRADQGVWERKETLCRGGKEALHTPGIDTEGPLIPLPIPSHHAPELLKASLNVVVGEELALDGPEDLAHKTTAQIGLCLHTLVRAALPLVIDRGPNSWLPPPPSRR